MARFRLAVVNTHPIQYFAPLYRRLAKCDDLELDVMYCSRQGVGPGFLDPGFGREVVWNVPLLDGYPNRFLPNVGGDRGVRGFFSLLNPSAVTAILRNRYDAVIVHGHNYATNLLAIAAAKLVGTRVFMRGETHLLLDRGSVKRRLRRPVMSLFYKACDACLYIGARNRAFYEAHGVPSAKLFFVPYTVDNDFFAQASRLDETARRECVAGLGLDPGAPIVLFASKLIERKRPADLLHALARLEKDGIAAAAIFVGDGELRESLEQLARGLGLKNVAFVGFVNQGELPRYYAMADVFVLPSENEPWGLVINEVMASGLPVVASSSVGACADLVIEGVTGSTYPQGDVARLAAALAPLLANRELRARMGAAAKERMRDWSYETCVAGIRDALRRTVRG